MSPNDKSVTLALAMVLALAAGCTLPMPPPQRPASRPAGPESDPCAERLHEVAGQLLMFYVEHRQLPDALAQLNLPEAQLSCPVCKRPYVYDPQGVLLSNLSVRAVLWDPQPCHSGVRWAVVMDEPKPGKPLSLNVIPIAQDPAAGNQRP